MYGRPMRIEHGGQWLAAVVLWQYPDAGRTRALVRFETPGGFTVRRPCWLDELREPHAPQVDLAAAGDRVVELDLLALTRTD